MFGQLSCRRLVFGFLAALALAGVADERATEAIEFAGLDVRAKVVNPNGDPYWRIGDDNGNGVLDDNEQLASLVPIAAVFHDYSTHVSFEPVSTFLPAPSFNQSSFAPNSPAEDFQGFDVIDPGRVPDAPLPFDQRADLDDVVTLAPLAGARLGASSLTRPRSFQLMHVLSFETSEQDGSGAFDRLELSYGVRFFESRNFYDAYFTGGLLEFFAVNTTLNNQAVGPQLSAEWTRAFGRWHANVGAAGSLAYLTARAVQSGALGRELVAGQFNAPLFFNPNRVANQLRTVDLSPIGDASAGVSFDLTRNVLCFVRGDAIYVGNLRQADDSTILSLTQQGLTDGGGHDFTIASGMIGVEARR